MATNCNDFFAKNNFKFTQPFQAPAFSIMICLVDLYQLVKAVKLKGELGETSHVEHASEEACSAKPIFILQYNWI